MKIRNNKVDRKDQPHENEAVKIPFYQHSDVDSPMPMQAPDKSKYSMKGARASETVGRKGYDKRLRDNKKKRSQRLAALRDADPHTIWVRKDIWAALTIFKEREKRSLRSCVEEALYVFLIKEGRVKNVEDMGENPDASWTKETE